MRSLHQRLSCKLDSLLGISLAIWLVQKHQRCKVFLVASDKNTQRGFLGDCLQWSTLLQQQHQMAETVKQSRSSSTDAQYRQRKFSHSPRLRQFTYKCFCGLRSFCFHYWRLVISWRTGARLWSIWSTRAGQWYWCEELLTSVSLLYPAPLSTVSHSMQTTFCSLYLRYRSIWRKWHVENSLQSLLEKQMRFLCVCSSWHVHLFLLQKSSAWIMSDLDSSAPLYREAQVYCGFH